MLYMVENFYVYEHVFSNKVHYIGKGRLARIKAGRSSRLNSKYWVHLYDKYGAPSGTVLAGPMDEELALLAEMEAIAQRKALGIPLCNLTDGGEGVSGRVLTAEERAKIKIRTKQFYIDNPGYARRNADRMARMNSHPERAKINAERLKAALADPIIRAKANEKRKAAQNTPEAKQRSSEASRQRWADPDMREKIMKRIQARDMSKVSPAMKALFADKNNHPRTDHTQYTFVHKDGSVFIGKRIDLCTTYGVSATQLAQVLSGRFKSTLGWSVKKD